jgi:hypothetical protein
VAVEASMTLNLLHLRLLVELSIFLFRVMVTPAGSMAQPAQQATGGALVLGAYGFLLMLRRRTLR